MANVEQTTDYPDQSVDLSGPSRERYRIGRRANGRREHGGADQDVVNDPRPCASSLRATREI
jgi:hypothetical protein